MTFTPSAIFLNDHIFIDPKIVFFHKICLYIRFYLIFGLFLKLNIDFERLHLNCTKSECVFKCFERSISQHKKRRPKPSSML